MQLRNESPFAAAIQVAQPRAERVAVVIVKSTFDLDAQGMGKLSSQQVPLVTRYLETEYGAFHGEAYFKKQGVDLCVMGTVRSHQPVRKLSVRLSLAERRWELAVHGNRTWQRSASGELTPSEPEPFTEMPLGYARAFGGHRTFDDGSAVLFSDNPSGRGYYQSEEQALGSPLPNIEAIGVEPLRRWSDETRVVGWGPYPSPWGLRARPSVEVNPETNKVKRVLPSLFNHAHPDLVLDAAPSGKELRVDGLRPQPVRVRIPRPPGSVRVRVGGEEIDVPAPIDGVFVWCDDEKLVLTQRARLAYALRAEEHREATVRVDPQAWS